MTLLIALLLVAAVVLAVLRAFDIPRPGPSRHVDLGWLAIACVIAAVWTIHAIAAA
jgi:hypothetical protein